jgi:hypothetical protein
VWTYVGISTLRLPFPHPNEKLPTFSKEVGFGRRLRGNANGVYILGGILLEKRHESMVLDNLLGNSTHLGNKKTKWIIHELLTILLHRAQEPIPLTVRRAYQVPDLLHSGGWLVFHLWR